MKENIYLKKELRAIKNVRVKSSTIYTKFHKSCNKASMLETSNEDYEEKVIKEKNIILSKNSTDSFP